MSSILTADRWLYEILSEDAELITLIEGRIYVDSAPQGATLPFIVFSLLSRMNTMEVGTSIIWADEVWLVKVIGEQNYTSLEDIANRVSQVLHTASGTVSSGAVIQCIEEQMIRFSEVESGKIYKHIGIQYRIYTQ